MQLSQNPSSYTVLLVDDESGVRRVLRDVIETSGFQVVEARDGRAALDSFKRQTPDLVLTDLMMDGMDGWELLREVKGLNPDTPVIVLTGFLPEQGEKLLTDAEPDAYILKPIDTARLITLLRALLMPQNLGRQAEIIAVDDDLGTLRLIETSLSRRGILTRSCSEANQALEAIAEGTYDAAIIDINIAGHSGFDFYGELQSSAGTPALILTSTPTRENVERAVELGVSGFVAKPFRPQDLAERVVKLLRQIGAQPTL